MNKPISFLTITFLFILSFESIAQPESIKKYNVEKEKILNTILNSPQFDSVYRSKRVYFASNELLSLNTSLVLKKGRKKVRIKDERKLKNKAYVVIGDLIMARENPQTVRVQLEILPQQKTLNLRLVKKELNWVIDNYVIFLPD